MIKYIVSFKVKVQGITKKNNIYTYEKVVDISTIAKSREEAKEKLFNRWLELKQYYKNEAFEIKENITLGLEFRDEWTKVEKLNLYEKFFGYTQKLNILNVIVCTFKEEDIRKGLDYSTMDVDYCLKHLTVDEFAELVKNNTFISNYLPKR